MHFSAPTILALAMVTGAAACASNPASPTSPSATAGPAALTADQAGGTWTLTSIQRVGQAEQPAPNGATYDLAFAEGRVSARADCNRCSGSVAIDGESVTVGPALACTRAACPTMAFENDFVGILAGDSIAKVDGNTLTLSSSRGVLRFRR